MIVKTVKTIGIIRSEVRQGQHTFELSVDRMRPDQFTATLTVTHRQGTDEISHEAYSQLRLEIDHKGKQVHTYVQYGVSQADWDCAVSLLYGFWLGRDTR